MGFCLPKKHACLVVGRCAFLLPICLDKKACDGCITVSSLHRLLAPKYMLKNEIKNKSTFIHIDFFDFGVKKVDFREKKQKGLRFLERVEGRKRKKSVVYC